MRLQPPPLYGPYRLFLSSSNDAPLRRLRKRVKTLVEDVINPQLLNEYPDAGVTVYLDVWDRVAAQSAHGEPVNEIFVKKVKESQFTLVLLHDELKSGTREELDAAIAVDGEVGLICFEPSPTLSKSRRATLKKHVKSYEGRVLLNRVGSPQSDDAWIGLTRILVGFTLAALKHNDLTLRGAPLVERR